MTELRSPIVHVIIIGFHHKKGCQVEYSYPPLLEGNLSDSNEVPEEWKSLPSLALPDGAHNYNEDTIFFHLPSREKPSETLYGISCYRQVKTSELINLSTEVTRNSVQKSVCILSRLPLYGVIQSKLELITHAYFQGRDLAQHDLMEQMYHTLNGVISTELLFQDSQIYFGFSCKSVLLNLQQQLLMLFKLVLLEKRVLIFSSPVKPVCSVIITLLSLFPELIQNGLSKSTRIPKIKIPPIKLDPIIVAQNYASMKNPILLSQSCDESNSESLKFSRDISEFKVRFSRSSTNIENQIEDNTNITSNSDKTIDDQDDFKSISSQNDISSDILNDNLNNLSSISKNVVDLNLSTELNLNNSGLSNKNEECISTLQFNKPNNNLENKMNLFETTHMKENLNCNKIEIPKLIYANKELEYRDEEDMECLLLDSEVISFNSDRLHLEVCDDLSNASSINNDEATIDEIESSTNKLSQMGLEIRDKLTNLWSNKSTIENNENKSKNGSTEDIFQDCIDKEILLGDGYSKSKIALDTPKDGETTVIYDELLVNDFGFPLAIFINGVLCHPYLSLHMFDILTNSNISGFLIGASNSLFLQKMQFLDVTFELSDGNLNIPDPELRKCLQLSTADLRFVDHLLKTISLHESEDDFFNGTEWEGGDDWIRKEFKEYLLSFLSVVSTNDDKLIEDYNSNFVNAWKLTNNYAIWSQNVHPSFSSNSSQHPHRGQLSVNDMKIRFNQVIHNVDKGKRISTAVNTTGRVVSQTGKAVGSVVSSARSTVTGWFSNFSSQK